VGVQQLRTGALDVHVLGPLEVTEGDRRLEISGVRARGLVALLARSAGRAVEMTEIVRQVWGLDASEAGNPVVRNAVQARVSSLRRVLGSDVLRAVPGGYLLDLPSHAIDTARFEASLAEARRLRQVAGIDEVAEAYRRALGHWRGENAYADVRHVPGLAEEGERLGELRLQALQESVAVQVDGGRYGGAATELMQLTRLYPQVEEFWALRMHALYRQGRQADALAVYREATRVLDQRFGLAPGARLREVEALILRGAAAHAAGVPSLGPPRISRPATSFLGREGELDATLEVLRRTRLLTLTGPGGVGKTRLALEVTQELLNQRAPVVAHGIAVVDLVQYSRGDDLAAAVLDALGAVAPPGGTTSAHRARKALQTLRDVLRERRLVLMLDNCEHVARDVAALCSALLTTTSGTTILATSRQPLDVPGEAVHAVAPLVVPADLEDPYALAGLPAVRLFLDRATARHPGPVLDAAGVRAVARICRRLDGIPLAIELAAVRTSGLGLAEVERLLDDRLRLLDQGSDAVPDRHRTLESVVAWSYHLLDREEQLALPRLSVFRGSFLAQQVSDLWTRLGDDSAAVPALLDQLVTKSIMQAEAADSSSGRFRLLESVRLSMSSKLEDSGETERVERAHTDVYVSVATSCGEQLRGAGQTRALRTLMLEDGNIRAALQRALDHGLGDHAQALIGALGYVIWMRGGRVPSWALIVRVMHLPVHDPGIRMRALAWVAHLGSVFGRLPEAVHFAEQAAELGRVHPETSRADLAFAQVARAHALHRLSRWEEGDGVLQEARRLADSSGDRWVMAAPSMARGLGLLARGRIADAEAEFLAAGEHYRVCADGWAQQRVVQRRARAHEARGDYAGAAELLTRSVELVADIELPEVVAPAKAALARVTLMAGDIVAGRRIVEDLVRSPAVLVLDAPAAQLAQCEAILAEADGRTSEAVRRHLDAGLRLADAGLCAEAVESWARVVVLAERESPQLAAALGAAEQVAVTSEDPRVLATVRDMRSRSSGQ
jgi:predicted ATPase/DNA-binding SARP family transcriptional activator